MKKFLIILPVAVIEKEPLREGKVYTEKNMRPYIEVLPPFQTTTKTEDLKKILNTISCKYTWFRDITVYGESENKEKLVLKSLELEKLHGDLLESIPTYDYGKTTWSCEDFKPVIRQDSRHKNKYVCYNLVLLKQYKVLETVKYEVVFKTHLSKNTVAQHR